MTHRPLLTVLALALAAGCGDDDSASTSGGGGGGAGATSTAPSTDASATTTDSATATTTTTTTTVGAGGGAPTALSILTWNIQSFPKTSSSPSAVATVIAQELPIIAGFQEVDEVDALEDALDGVTEYDVVFGNEPPYALVAAVDHARAAILNAGTIFDEESYLFPRAPLVSRIKVLDSGFELDIVVVHQKALIDQESQDRRKEANERLVAWSEARFAATGAPIVLIGDFNDQVTDPPVDDVFEAFRSATAPAYWFVTAPSEESGEYSYVPFHSFIDHQVATDNLRETFPTAQVQPLHLEAEIDDYVSRVTDHRPVRVDFMP